MTSIDLDHIDFVDFGCSNGNSMRFAETRLNGKRGGIGIDSSEEKVRNAQQKGLKAICADAAFMEFHDGSVSLSTLIHFLEHLSDARIAAEVLKSATRISRDFIYVRQPWFGSEDYLAALGLKQFWSDWTVHQNHMSILDYYKCAREEPKDWIWRIFGHEKIDSSIHDSILPLEAPKNQHQHNRSRHGSKDIIVFEAPVYVELVVIAHRPDYEADWLVEAWGDLHALATFAGAKSPSS